MSDSLAGFVMAAGAGTRLHPLTYVRPKALCPIDNVPLVDLAIARVRAVVGSRADDLAVNVHHGVDQMVEHLESRVHVSIEPDRARGTAGALGFARSWIDGRDVLVTNADAWCTADLEPFVEGWDHERVRLLLVGDGTTLGLQPDSRVVAALMPSSAVDGLSSEPSGLYECSWREAASVGQLEVLTYDGPFVDCGTPRDYLRANLLASGGASVVAPGAEVHGEIERTVVWDTGQVAEGECLVDAIRLGYRPTVLIR